MDSVGFRWVLNELFDAAQVFVQQVVRVFWELNLLPSVELCSVSSDVDSLKVLVWCII